jgi:hypothetical protein
MKLCCFASRTAALGAPVSLSKCVRQLLHCVRQLLHCVRHLLRAENDMRKTYEEQLSQRLHRKTLVED